MAQLAHRIADNTGTFRGSSNGDREYAKTHPWISFKVDLREAPFQLWLLLGEARSKCEHIAGVPLRPTTAESLHHLYLAKGVRATTAIEGNSLSEKEVSEIVLGTSKLPPSKEYLGREVQNILTVCNEVLADLSEGKELKLSPERIKELNRRVLEGLAVEDWVVPGEIPARSVGVGNYRGAPRQDCEYLLAELCQWLSDPSFADEEHLGSGAPILKAIIAHLYIAFIHPFGDGNGRTARLIEFQILVSTGIPSPAAHLLSNHYNETRTEYYRQLDMVKEGPAGFILYALRGFVDGLRAQLDLILWQQLDVAWENFIHGTFRDRSSPADTRRRHLVLDLSKSDGPVPRSKVRLLTPRLAEAYAGKTDKAVSRDINALRDLGLITRVAQGWVANKQRIVAFLPISAPADVGEQVHDHQIPLLPSEDHAGPARGRPRRGPQGQRAEGGAGGNAGVSRE